MIAHAIFFYIFAFIGIVSAIMVTASKNTVHSVFFLILDFISISCLFIMIGRISWHDNAYSLCGSCRGTISICSNDA